MNNKASFAEIIESSLQTWTAQCWQWDYMADFATLMVVEEQERTIFGLIYAIQTGSWQQDRTPTPYQKTEAELRQEQPQIFEFLRTTFACLTLGYQEPGQDIVYQYAPQPPKIHRFVRPATEQEVLAFFANNRFLPTIFTASHLFNLEEVLLGLIKMRIKMGLFEPHQSKEFIDAFSLLTGNDYRRLKLFLHRLEPLIAFTGPQQTTESRKKDHPAIV